MKTLFLSILINVLLFGTVMALSEDPGAEESILHHEFMGIKNDNRLIGVKANCVGRINQADGVSLCVENFSCGTQYSYYSFNSCLRALYGREMPQSIVDIIVPPTSNNSERFK